MMFPNHELIFECVSGEYQEIKEGMEGMEGRKEWKEGREEWKEGKKGVADNGNVESAGAEKSDWGTTDGGTTA